MAQEYEMIADNAPIEIGATGLADVMQCIRTIVRTLAYSVPMDRTFASAGSYIDSPLPHAVAARIAELTEAIERHEPRVTVTSIRLAAAPGEAMDGRLRPVIRFRLRKEGRP